MTYENKPGSGALFKNEKKSSDKAPDYRGPYWDTIEGTLVEREIAAWIKKSKAGQTYMSVQVSDKFVPSKPLPAQDSESFDDEIPF